jgi:thioredoxin reductase
VSADASPLASSVDRLIIGGGPAGLTAAIYAARFYLSVVKSSGVEVDVISYRPSQPNIDDEN